MKAERKALTRESFLKASFQAYAESKLRKHTKQQIRVLEVAARCGKELEPSGPMAGKKRV